MTTSTCEEEGCYEIAEYVCYLCEGRFCLKHCYTSEEWNEGDKYGIPENFAICLECSE